MIFPIALVVTVVIMVVFIVVDKKVISNKNQKRWELH